MARKWHQTLSAQMSQRSIAPFFRSGRHLRSTPISRHPESRLTWLKVPPISDISLTFHSINSSLRARSAAGISEKEKGESQESQESEKARQIAGLLLVLAELGHFTYEPRSRTLRFRWLPRA